jgi:hypothetical protein
MSGIKRALLLSLGALLVSMYALSVSVWAAVAAVVPPLRRVLFNPEQLRVGNCHVYSWLKYLNDGGVIQIEPSISFRHIPHSCHIDREARYQRSEFVPHAPYRDWRAFIASLWFKGRISVDRNDVN